MPNASPFHRHRRDALCCGAAAVAGLFTSLIAEAGEPAAPSASPPASRPWQDWHPPVAELLDRTFDSLDPAALWDVHDRLLHGSDYPLPAVGLLYSTGRLVRAGLLAPEQVAPLEALRQRNPLLFDLALKRQAAWQGQRLSATVFQTRRHFGG